MLLQSIFLHNFRSYTQSSFSFDQRVTVIIGPNTAGKTNILEAIYLLATGHSFRSDRDMTMIKAKEAMGRIEGKIKSGNDEELLTVLLTTGTVGEIKTPFKRFLVNGVARRRIDFTGKLLAVLFEPSDLDVLTGSPSLRRALLDDTLEQISPEYRQSLLSYTKGLRQRNALLERMREEGIRDEKELSYWNEIVIKNGQYITKERENFITFLNAQEKLLFPASVTYDKSNISEERLLQYKHQEVAAGVTLVGPHRDDLFITMPSSEKSEFDVRYYGSRGQQRLAVLQIKLLQIDYIEKFTHMRPLLLLDDIFSELDTNHIGLVLSVISKQQTVITTTHEEFIPEQLSGKIAMIQLEKKKS